MAEALPFANAAFDAALAVLTVHHWIDVPRGLAEMRRVASRRVVVLTWDQEIWETFWLIREYLPSIAALDRRRAVPLDEIVSALGRSEVLPVPIPHDCTDGFHGAFWRRPEAYLDPVVRAGISTYALVDPADRDEGLGRLRADLESGAWAARHADVVARDELDLGYRLIVTELRPS
jgi:SAM-dependent methyltransferase